MSPVPGHLHLLVCVAKADSVLDEARPNWPLVQFQPLSRSIGDRLLRIIPLIQLM